MTCIVYGKVARETPESKTATLNHGSKCFGKHVVLLTKMIQWPQAHIEHISIVFSSVKFERIT